MEAGQGPEGAGGATAATATSTTTAGSGQGTGPAPHYATRPSRLGTCPICSQNFPLSYLPSHTALCLTPEEEEELMARSRILTKRPRPASALPSASKVRVGEFTIEAFELPEKLMGTVRKADANAMKMPIDIGRYDAPMELVGKSAPDDSIGFLEQVDRLAECTLHSMYAVEHILWHSTGTMDRSPVTKETASSYWNALLYTFKDDPSKPVEAIAHALNGFKQGYLNHAELMHVVAVNLAGHDRLLLSFDMFLPPQYSMTNLLMLQKTAVLTACAIDKSLQADEARLQYIAKCVTEEAALALRVGKSSETILRAQTLDHHTPTIDFELVNAWVDQVGQRLGVKTPSYQYLLKNLIALGDAGSSTKRQDKEALVKSVRDQIKDHKDLLSIFDVIVSSAL